MRNMRGYEGCCGWKCAELDSCGVQKFLCLHVCKGVPDYIRARVQAFLCQQVCTGVLD